MAFEHMTPVAVNIIVPLENHIGDILVLASGATLRLPGGQLRAGERMFDAARRIAMDQLKAPVRPLRLLYVAEESSRVLAFSILCEISEEVAEPNPDAVFVNLLRFDGQFEPAILREVLTEDSVSGFYRPTAHLVSRFDEAGTIKIDINW